MASQPGSISASTTQATASSRPFWQNQQFLSQKTREDLSFFSKQCALHFDCSNCHQLKRVELFDCQLITKAGTRRLRVIVLYCPFSRLLLFYLPSRLMLVVLLFSVSWIVFFSRFLLYRSFWTCLVGLNFNSLSL